MPTAIVQLLCQLASANVVCEFKTPCVGRRHKCVGVQFVIVGRFDITQM